MVVGVGSKPSLGGYVYRCVIVVCVTFVGLCCLAVVVPAPVAGVVSGCWWEPNASMPGGVEPMGGSLAGAPVGSVVRPC